VANTYTQLYVQIVVAVRGRDHVIQGEHKDEIQKVMTGIVSHLGSKMISINNMPDHFHLLVGLKLATSVSELAGKVKSGSAKFIQEKRWIGGHFEGQEGFGAFSYSRSQLPAVVRYIENQETHHRRAPRALSPMTSPKTRLNHTEREGICGSARPSLNPPASSCRSKRLSA